MSDAQSPSQPQSHSLFAAVKWLAIAKLGTQFLSWISTYYIATLLLPSDYGLSSMATAFTQFAQLFANMGIGITIIQRPDIEEKELHNLFTFSLILGVVSAVASFFLAYLGGWYFRRTDIIPLTQFTAVVFIGNALSIVPYNMLNRDMRFRERGLVDIYSTFISVAVMVYMAYIGTGAWALIGGTAVRAFTRTGYSLWYARYKPKLFLNWPLLKQDLLFSLPVTFNGLMFLLKDKSIPLVLGRFFSATQLGYYSLANTLSDIPNQKIVQIVREILLPLMSRKDDDERVTSLYTALKFCTLVITPTYIAGFWYGAPILEACFPNKWADMAPIFAGLCLVQIFIVLSSIVAIFVTASGKPGRSSHQEFLLALLIPGFTYAFHKIPMNSLPYVWGAVHAAVFAGWMWVLFRRSGDFLGRLLGLNAQIIGACCAFVAVDWAFTRFVPGADFRFSAFVRAGFFLAAYLVFVYVFHRDFMATVRKK